MNNKSKRFRPEFRDRAAHMVLEEEKNHPSRCSAVTMIAPKLDIHPDTLSKWTRLYERANEILRKASAYFAEGELDRRFMP